MEKTVINEFLKHIQLFKELNDRQLEVICNKVKVENYSTNKLNCLIYTMDGIEVCNETIANNETAHLINLEHLPSGVYQLKLTNSTKQILIKKLVKI